MSRPFALAETPEALADRTLVEEFLFLEARLLDERRLEDWEALFTADGEYWVPARPGQPDPYSEVSIFHDDRELMRTRIQRLRHPEVHVQTPPSRTVRTISNVRIEPHLTSGDTLIVVTSSLLMLEYRKGKQRLFGGLVTHSLVPHRGSFQIRRKKVELINADDTLPPLAVPF